MKVINPSISLLGSCNAEELLKNIELAGRVCYKSEDKITGSSAALFIEKILKRGHEAVIEHEHLSFKVVCDRGVSHEIVRHRLASYCQESTRYCNYSQDRFENELTFIKPCFWEDGTKEFSFWKNSMSMIEQTYLGLIEIGCSPQEARSVLPNSLKTEIVVTMNMREWRHFLCLRTSQAAHPQMREVAIMIYDWFKLNLPIFVVDIDVIK